MTAETFESVSNDEFAKRMMLLADTEKSFEPSAYYDADGDCIEFIASPQPFYGERVDGLVTVYFSQATGEVIGSLIKGVSNFCSEILSRNPGFAIEIESGDVVLQHVFLARLWSIENADPKDIPVLTYKKLINISRDTKVSVPAAFLGDRNHSNEVSSLGATTA